MSFCIRAVLTFAIVGLAGCGGGGGSSSSSDGGVSTPPPITNLPTNATTKLDGQSISADYDRISITPLPAGGASTTLTTRDGQVVAVSLTADPSTNIAFDVNNGDTIRQNASAVVATSSSGDKELALANGYQHQTFGVWIDGPPAGSGTVGAGSFGRIKTTTLPSGTASYTGTSAGYLQQGTDRYLTSSNIEVTTPDFEAVTINSINTQAVSVSGGELSNSKDYNFTGTGTVSGSGFQANVTSTGDDTIFGNANGQFYGPTAEEVGGTFALEGEGGKYLGAFGARQ